MEDDSAPPSLRAKLKNSLYSYCCFRRLHHRHRQLPGSPPSGEKPAAMLWLKALAPHGNGRHRRNSSEFRYDALSYALNFEDGFDDGDEYPLRNFSSLPAAAFSAGGNRRRLVLSVL